MPETHSGTCFCGAIEVEVAGAPVAMGYCHCASCRQWSAGPVNAFTLWPPGAVRITRGEDRLGAYRKTDLSLRKFCTDCGGHVLTDHPVWGIVDVYAAILPTLAFTPGVHVNYGEAVLRIPDGLPKLRDFPADMGGSGETMAE
jgi:hypothetical protein